MRRLPPPVRLVPVVVLGLAATGAVLLDSASAAPATCQGRTVTILGSPSNDDLEGTSGDDVIAGRGGNDDIEGRGGDDLVCGGSGTDDMAGGTGRDRLYGGGDFYGVTEEGSERIGDRLVGGPGDDLLVPGADTRDADDVQPDLVSWAAATGRMRVDLGQGSGAGDGVGTDRLLGHGFAILTGDFADRVTGSDFADDISTGDGGDWVDARGGPDKITVDAFGTGGRDLARGGPGRDWITAYGGSDLLLGGRGDDIVSDSGGTSIDRLYGGEGADRLVDELGRADLFPDQVADGGPGRDSLLLSTFGINPAFDPAEGSLRFDSGLVEWTDATGTVEMLATQLEGLDLSTEGTQWEVWGDGADEDVWAAGTDGTEFHGVDGDDSFYGSSGDDWFDAGPGTDTGRFFGPGTDVCDSVEVYAPPEAVEECEAIDP